MDKELKPLNHIALSNTYPKAYEVLKDIWENAHPGRQLWIHPTTNAIEIIDDNNYIVDTLQDMSLIYFLDLLGLHCYVLPEYDNDEVVFSGMILRPDLKHHEVCRKKKDRKEVERLFILRGIKMLNELLSDGVIIYKKI